MKKIFLAIAFAAISAVSCVNMDIPPKNIVTDDDLLSNSSGMAIYMSRLYTQMPWEDFKYIAYNGFDGNSFLGCLGIEGTGEAINRSDDICRSFTSEKASLWGRAYTLVHDANHLIKALPEYRSKYSEIQYNEFLGQAYFVRAFVFTQMAKRFGGVPIVKEEISYPFEDDVEIARFSERDTWDAILEDWDTAIELLPPAPTFSYTATRYAALAFKSDAMLYAGSVAKYNEQVHGLSNGLFGKKTGVRVIGFATDEWEECSNKYFAEAYKAAKAIIDSKAFSLYKKSWVADDKEAQYKNMNDMWRDLTSPENILVRVYEYPIASHGLDAYSSPWIYRMPLSAGTCPTEDFMELFDGFDTYEDGGIRVTDGTSHSNGHYLFFDDPMDLFKDVEPRLRAYVIFPNDVFKKTKIEVRMGFCTEDLPISPLKDSYEYSQRGRFYQHLSKYNDKSNKTLYLSPNVNTEPFEYVNEKGDTIKCYAAGENGPFFTNSESTITGLHLRKYLDPDRALEDIGEGKSDQPFILARYGEVLLNAAEAAVELAIAGQPSPVDDDMLAVATDAIKSIQERAGAKVITADLIGDMASRDIVRKERRKELAFEQKSKWDIRRWRVCDEDNRDYFWGFYKDKRIYGDGNSYAFQGLYPFYSTKANKWFFDICFDNHRTYSYSTVNYYFAIPSGEVTKSNLIDQQPNR